MKRFLKELCKRGLIAFGFGPVIAAIVYLCIAWAGVEDTLTLAEAGKQILLVSVMAFLAGGVTAVYQIERLPLPFAIFIQATVLYIDYLGIYLINGWLQNSIIPIIVFSVIFVVGFALVWLIVYIVTKKAAMKLNSKLNTK